MTQQILDPDIRGDLLAGGEYFNPKNLIDNGDFEQWNAGISIGPGINTKPLADGWTGADNTLGATVSRDTEHYTGTYSLKFASNDPGGGSTLEIYSAPISNYVKGRVMIATLWVKTAVADKLLFYMYDGIGYHASAKHSGSGNWERLSVKFTVNAAATTLFMIVTAPAPASGDIYYLDSASVVDGSLPFSFAPNPLDKSVSVVPGDGIFQSQDISAENMLHNSNFENWSRGISDVPDGWIASIPGVGSIVRWTGVKEGVYSAQLNYTSGPYTHLYQSIPFTYASSIGGRYWTFSAWVWSNAANSVYLRLYDGGNLMYSPYHSGNSGWEYLSVTSKFIASPTLFWAAIFQLAGGTVARIDGASVVRGKVSPAYNPHPNDLHRFKILAATRNMTSASGDVAYTGVGFTPKKVTVIAIADDTGARNPMKSDGFFTTAGDGSHPQAATFQRYDGNSNHISTRCIVLQPAATLQQDATFKTMDIDGFTLTWVKSNLPVGTGYLYFMCEG